MSLTTAQEIALFQILEVPWQPQANVFMDQHNLVYQQYNVSDSTRNANLAIRNYVANYISTTSAAETVLVSLLNRWIELGTDTISLVGGVGPIQGVTSDPDRERAEVARQVKILVPFYRSHLEVERDKGGSAFVGIIR